MGIAPPQGSVRSPSNTYSMPRDGSALWNNFTAAGSLLCRTGTGILKGVHTTKAAAGSTLTLYDGTSAAGTLIGVWDTSSIQNFDSMNLNFTTGLFAVVAGGTPNVIVSYAP